MREWLSGISGIERRPTGQLNEFLGKWQTLSGAPWSTAVPAGTFPSHVERKQLSVYP